MYTQDDLAKIDASATPIVKKLMQGLHDTLIDHPLARIDDVIMFSFIQLIVRNFVTNVALNSLSLVRNKTIGIEFYQTLFDSIMKDLKEESVSTHAHHHRDKFH